MRAAKAFLATLDAPQRQTVLFAFNDEATARALVELSGAIVPRGGISLKDMSASAAVRRHGAGGVGAQPRGFEKVQQIMEGDEVQQDQRGERPSRWAGGPGGPGGGPGRRWSTARAGLTGGAGRRSGRR